MSRFSLAWADVARENNLLKILTFSLTGIACLLGVTSMRLALRPPLVIERSCITKAVATAQAAHTDAEIETFLKESISQRFNTDVVLNGDLLSLDELKARASEQEELKRREIKQRVLVNSITKVGDRISADTDRLFSVGAIRSAFVFPLQIQFETTDRTESNPYGLVLTKVKSTGDDAKEKKSGDK